jgi:preprotein translocase subunit SecB
MYPFVREAITSAAVKAHLLGLVLPIANVGALFTSDEIEIPTAPEEGGEKAPPE